MDNINFYSNWIPAWQQTDSYTTQPWCLLSKNVDIFSSSKSIKATAFSEPVAWDSWVIASEWWLELRNDGKIYDSEWTLVVDPSANFPVYDVSYTGKDWTYAPAQFGTPQSMSVATDWNTWQSIQVFTDRTSYTYTKVPFIIPKTITIPSKVSYAWIDSTYWYKFYKNNDSWAQILVVVNLWSAPFIWSIKMKLKATDTSLWMSLNALKVNPTPWQYYYDAQTEDMVAIDWWQVDLMPEHPEDIFSEDWIEIDIPVWPTLWDQQVSITMMQTEQSVYYPWHWDLYIDVNWLVVDSTAQDYEDQIHHLMSGSTWDYNEYYWYLGINDRELKQLWEYYWLKWTTYQKLYKREPSWVYYNWNNVPRYDFVSYMGWENDPRMDIITMIEYKERVYMVGNMNGNWYIIPCDLSWGKWTATMFPWVQFLWWVNKDYLIYLCWTDRWVSTLWAYNWQELVPVVSWSQEMSSKDLVDNVEQYRFDGSMVIYRNNIVLGTTDNRLFRYWQTYWGRWGSFIYVLPSWATLDKLEAVNNDLIIHYTLNQIKYTTTYQDDIPVQRFNTEYEVVYPIVIWNHILEKEDTDLYVSYLLPSANTSLEFWAMNNHYQYWTFTSEENVTLDTTKDYKMVWAWGTYDLKFIERNWNQYTFELDGNLPVQTSNEMKIKDNENTVVLNYTSYNHFRLIWTLSTDKCEESKFRFTGLNNKLNLTKTHSMQIMVKGKWTTQYTPELFALNLVATQRDRW